MTVLVLNLSNDREAGKPSLRLENVLRVIEALDGEVQLDGLPVMAMDATAPIFEEEE